MKNGQPYRFITLVIGILVALFIFFSVWAKAFSIAPAVGKEKTIVLSGLTESLLTGKFVKAFLVRL